MSWFEKPYDGSSFDSENMALIKEAFEAAWHEICCTSSPFTAQRTLALRDRLAQTILHLAEKGERKPAVLKTRALMALRASERLS
jgi:hypothetical protein